MHGVDGRRRKQRPHPSSQHEDPYRKGNIMSTDCCIASCPRNQAGQCELSKFQEVNGRTDPDHCTHYAWKIRLMGSSTTEPPKV
jgi:hypothetical protein